MYALRNMNRMTTFLRSEQEALIATLIAEEVDDVLHVEGIDVKVEDMKIENGASSRLQLLPHTIYSSLDRGD